MLRGRGIRFGRSSATPFDGCRDRRSLVRMAMRGVVEQPSGLSYRDELISAAEETELLEHVGRLEMTPLVLHGVPSRRLTRHFGVG